MISCQTMPLDIFLKLDPSDLKNSQRPIKMPDQKLPPMCKSNNSNMGIIQSPCILINFFQSHLMSWVEIDVVENHHEFFYHIVNFSGWLYLCCDQYFYGNCVVQNLIELIHFSLLIILNLLLVCYLFVFDCLRLLSLLCWQFLSLFSLFHFKLVLLRFSFLVNLDSFYFVLDIMSLDFYSLVELGDCLWLINKFLLLICAFFLILLFHCVLLLALFPHC